VGKMFSREITGRSLNTKIHQHHKRRVHLAWNLTLRKKVSIERRFYYGIYLDKMLHELRTFPISGICSCLWVSDYILDDRRRFERCLHPQYGPFPWKNQIIPQIGG
jgi:hypothetical protein